MLRTHARPARVLASALAAISILTLTAAAGTASAASPTATMGLYTGARDLSGVGDFETWVGKPVGNVLDFLPKTDWSKIDNPNWWVSGWGATEHPVEYSVPMIPSTGGTLQAGAAGEYNQHFVNLAKSLVAGGQGDATLRLGWEFNGAWFKWSAKDDPAAFAAYWRQIVNTMRSVPGQTFKFDWCPTAAKGAVAPDLAYPGDAYVDYIGQDIYDQSWIPNYKDPQARWQDYLTRPYGLQWGRSFAAAHNKPLTYPEWGLAIRPDGHGGGDNTYFIEKMYEWISANNVAFHNYFEFNGADGILHTLTGNTAFPQGAAKFRELFGSRGERPGDRAAARQRHHDRGQAAEGQRQAEDRSGHRPRPQRFARQGPAAARAPSQGQLAPGGRRPRSCRRARQVREEPALHPRQAAQARVLPAPGALPGLRRGEAVDLALPAVPDQLSGSQPRP